MSLQLAAQHLAAQGRGPDKQLVHMSPGEVKSLQQLAMAHGGSLSINPNTGLPEAGFLSSILPTIAGAALMATGVGAPMAALMVGGGMTAATGSLQKGLMAGLGAYGGAGLAGGLMGAGAAGAAEAAGSGLFGAVPEAAASAGLFNAAPEAALAGNMGGAESLVNFDPSAAAQPASGASLDAIRQAGRQSITDAFARQGIGLGPESTLIDIPPVTTTTPMPSPQAAFGGGSPVEVTGTPPPAPAFGGVSPVEVTGTPAPETFGSRLSQMGQGLQALGTEQGRSAFMSGVGGTSGLMKAGLAAAAPLAFMQSGAKPPSGGPNPYRYRFDYNPTNPDEGYTGARSGERRYFNPAYTRLAGGGPVEQMSNDNAVGANTGYPMANIQRGAYAVPFQQPISQNVVTGPQDTRVDQYTGEEKLAGGGLSHLGDYSDGGRLLKGPGDGVSDSIPAVIGNKRPARLADGEFVVPARIVSELGNGSTEAGARKLYAMMDRIQKARGKTTGKDKVAKNSRADRYLPA